ncbi:MAG: hypothetical protein H8K03_20355 [Nitrospira sp.]
MRIETFHVEWHLTPRGWVRGNWSTDKPLALKISPPDDRIETWVKIEITHDRQYSRTHMEWSLTWTSPQYSELMKQAFRTRIRVPAPESASPRISVWKFPPA